MRAEGRVHFTIKPEELPLVAEKAFRLGQDISPHILTSLEFYASARMETTDRARFIGLMTALEALSVQYDYGDDIGSLLTELASRLEESPLLQGDDKASLRSSLSGRLKGLRQESVRQAIVRAVREHMNDKETFRFVDEAYGVRSKILHEGLRAAELTNLTHRLEDVLRTIYSSILGLPLGRPTQL